MFSLNMYMFYICFHVYCSVVECKSTINDNTTYEFPNDFLFGVTSSAYQIEGGHDNDGKGQSIWDYYTERNPEKFANGSNGNISCDSYHNYKEDVQLLKRLGVDFYKFSISWSRILPDGYSNNRNMKGIIYYNNLLDELISKDIKPIVTMYHWDLPMRLQEIGGWTNPYMAYYFEDYARILFSYYGDKVKYWVTLNMACKGYGDDDFPPFLNQSGIGQYLCTNVMLLAHAKAYHLYDGSFRMKQKGKVGIVLDGNWFEPGSSSPIDIEATERVRAFKCNEREQAARQYIVHLIRKIRQEPDETAEKYIVSEETEIVVMFFGLEPHYFPQRNRPLININHESATKFTLREGSATTICLTDRTRNTGHRETEHRMHH